MDTGSLGRKAGLYPIRDEFNADGILVKGPTYRTNPIQIFMEPMLTEDGNHNLMELFNKILNGLRDETDGDFMTTYKYTDNPRYIRKYLGLKQAKEILTTISVKDLEMAGKWNGQ